MKEIYPGDVGTYVKYLQLALARAGLSIKIDGIFGESTCASLRRFLRGRGRRDAPCGVTDEVWELLIPYLKGYTVHRVAEGDTFWNLANRYHSSIQRLMLANPRLNPLNLLSGTMVAVPYDFPLVSGEVEYSSYLTDWVLEGLIVRYPFLRREQIGTSVIGRRISCLWIGEGSTQVFYNASFHANESITTPVLLKYAEDYADAFATGRPVGQVPASRLYSGYSLALVPLVNPDGVDLVNGVLDEPRYERMAADIGADYPQIPFPAGWKANIDGIDLNLQFPAGWENAKRIKFAQGYTSPAPRDYVGSQPLTAPESRAVYEFTERNRFGLILAYHTQGEVIYWKFLDYEPEGSLRIARYFQSVSGYAVEETPGVSGYAGYKDWFIQNYNLPGYTIEAGQGRNPLPMEQFDRIYGQNIGILTGGMTELRPTG